MISLWEKQSFYEKPEYLIVGSGFTGLWTAFFLSRKHPRKKITIIDGGHIPAGASTRNAGFFCFGSPTELMHDARSMGTDAMLELVEMRFKGLSLIRKYFDDSRIDASVNGGYELIPEGLSEDMKDIISYLNTLLKPVTGVKKTYSLQPEKLEKFNFGCTSTLVENELEGTLHPGLLVRSLMTEVQSRNVQILNHVKLKSFQDADGEVLIETDGLAPHSCGQLLICTNAFTKALLPEVDVVPARGQILVTSPIPNLPFEGSFHAQEGYYYFRNLGKRVLLGGARNEAFDEETTTEMQISDRIQQRLERFLAEVVLPGVTDYIIEDRWSGIMGMGEKKLPHIARVSENVFCAVRMSGMGVALAPVAARKLLKLLD